MEYHHIKLYTSTRRYETTLAMKKKTSTWWGLLRAGTLFCTIVMDFFFAGRLHVPDAIQWPIWLLWFGIVPSLVIQIIFADTKFRIIFLCKASKLNTHCFPIKKKLLQYDRSEPRTIHFCSVRAFGKKRVRLRCKGKRSALKYYDDSTFLNATLRRSISWVRCNAGDVSLTISEVLDNQRTFKFCKFFLSVTARVAIKHFYNRPFEATLVVFVLQKCADSVKRGNGWLTWSVSVYTLVARMLLV